MSIVGTAVSISSYAVPSRLLACSVLLRVVQPMLTPSFVMPLGPAKLRVDNVSERFSVLRTLNSIPLSSIGS